MGMRAFVAGSAALAVGVVAVGAGIAAASATTTDAGGGSPSARSGAIGAIPAAPSTVRVREGICTAPPAYRALAAKLSADIQDALRGRAGGHGVTVYDAVTKVSCYTDSERHFDSASIVKAIILGALLRWHEETGRPLSDWEKDEATLMITQSDNDAATALWNEVGMSRLQHFLDLAKMGETQLGQDG